MFAFLQGKILNPFVPNDLMLHITSPILFRNQLSGGMAHGYPATMLVNICEVVLTAQENGFLQKQQLHIAKRCDILLRGFARVGIIGLVDETTGYQWLREERARATILEKIIAKELQPWTKTFPYEFYKQIYWLKDWQGAKTPRRPSVIGHYTNDIVYSRLAPGVLDELKRRNPTLPEGTAKTDTINGSRQIKAILNWKNIWRLSLRWCVPPRIGGLFREVWRAPSQRWAKQNLYQWMIQMNTNLVEVYLGYKQFWNSNH